SDSKSTNDTNLTVSKAQTTTTIQFSTSGSVVLAIVKVAVVPPAEGIPTGVVTFSDGPPGTGITLGTAALDSSGTVTLAISNLGIPTNRIVACYSGDGCFEMSCSSPPIIIF